LLWGDSTNLETNHQAFMSKFPITYKKWIIIFFIYYFKI
jgi:hypothetical protein